MCNKKGIARLNINENKLPKDTMRVILGYLSTTSNLRGWTAQFR
jgi:hypothetical protein